MGAFSQSKSAVFLHMLLNKLHFLSCINHKQFKNTNLYRNELYISVLYKGIDSGKVGKSLSFFQRISNKAVNSARDDYRDRSVEKLIRVREQFITSLGLFKPRLLGSMDSELGYSEVLSFLALPINGLEEIKYRSSDSMSPSIVGIENGSKATSKTTERKTKPIAAFFTSIYSIANNIQGSKTKPYRKPR